MNSFVDQYDRRIFRNGQVIGVNYGGSVHQPTITYSTIPNLGAGRLPDPGPRYGESRPPVIFDNQEQKDTFNNFPQIIPMPYPVPTQGNQGNNQGGFNIGRAVGAMAGALGMGFGDPAFSPGPRFPRSPRYSGGLNIPGAPGNVQTLPYITSSPSFEIPGGQSPYRFGPYLPYRGEEKREEEMPFIPLPVQQAQGLPMGFQNKYVS